MSNALTSKKQAWYCETCHTRIWEAEAEIERLRRASLPVSETRESSPVETKWQPIATAPAGPWIFTGAFHKDGSGFWFDGPCSYSRDGIDLMRREGIRTHWAAAPRWLQDGPQQLETGEKHG